MKTTFIYALCEPGTRTIRDIGKSNCPERRLKEHWKQSRRRKNHLGYWLSSLSKPPSLLILREVPESEWEEWECRYIRCARALGFALVNATDGGNGCAYHSLIERRKISAAQTGRPCLSATRKKIGDAQRGELNHMFGKPGPNRGKPGTNLGKTFSKEHCARISAGVKGNKNALGAKRSPQTRERMRIAQALRWHKEKQGD